jgi:hypothetical protein
MVGVAVGAVVGVAVGAVVGVGVTVGREVWRITRGRYTWYCGAEGDCGRTGVAKKGMEASTSRPATSTTVPKRWTFMGSSDPGKWAGGMRFCFRCRRLCESVDGGNRNYVR